MKSYKNTLISLSSTGKVRFIEMRGYWEDKLKCAVIERITSQLGGKKTTQPFIQIYKGKAKRTLEEQLTLQYNSEKKKYLDKGYKDVLDLGLTDLTEENCKKALGDNKTNQDGILKPMLAKKYQDVSPKLLENEWFASRKINGVRCFLFYKDDEIKTIARGATNYDVATTHLRTNPKLYKFFKEHPNIILDGELYKFGWTLNKISGLCRKQDLDPEMEELEFYMYDVVDLEKPFPARLNVMKQISDLLGLSFEPERSWNPGDLKIQILPQDKVKGAENIKKMHDQFVKEGWEGLVIRDLTTPYKPGARGQFMLKYKQYQDAEYLTVGLEEGLRREDFTFVMETKDGVRFNAKPVGSREVKEYYRAHLNDIIGKMATLKYFEMSGAWTGVPQQPIWMNVRELE